MKLQLSDPDRARDLVDALNETDCFAALSAPDTVEVFALWLLDGGNTASAVAELLFFVRAWAGADSGLRATLVEA